MPRSTFLFPSLLGGPSTTIQYFSGDGRNYDAPDVFGLAIMIISLHLVGFIIFYLQCSKVKKRDVPSYKCSRCHQIRNQQAVVAIHDHGQREYVCLNQCL